jgi:pyruvate/2-oxoglutarate dehydrogenase complex dihydrolipoamide dehydrogenase (E3) component
VCASYQIRIYFREQLKMLELTPIAIRTGKLLSRRLFSESREKMDYLSVPTTIFTPIEYGCVGMSEEDALENFADDLEVFHSNFQPLEWTIPRRDANACYCKVLCNKVWYTQSPRPASQCSQFVFLIVKM